jgi:aminoglycoside 3-N-acetyltransferase
MRKGYTITPGNLLDSFLDAVGHSGTVLLPIFNFDFTRGVPFNIRTTRSQMGILPEAARVYPGVTRTGHPIYSFAVIGKNAHQFKGVNNFSGYGSDSPFALLKKLDGRIAVLDLADQNSMTFYHYVEEMNNVPYRFHKRFTGKYTDEDGITSERIYGLFVRDLEKGVVSHLDPAGELLWEHGLYKGDRPRINSGLRIISAREMYTFVNEIIVSGRAEGLLYTIEQDGHR